MDITWKVSTLERITDTGYVYEAGTVCIAKKTVDDKSMHGTTLLTTEFTAPIGPDFIPFEELTEQDILTWVFAEIGEDLKLRKEQGATNKLNNAIAALNPPTQEGVPWVG